MERIKSIEHLRMQKEFLQLQQMIAELRLKKEIHELKRKFSFPKILLPSVNGIVKSGLYKDIGKQILYTTAAKVAQKVFGKKKKPDQE